jgi:hypothetical protein
MKSSRINRSGVLAFIRKYYLFIALIVFTLLWASLFAYQKYLQNQIRERTDISSINGINSLEKISIGGVEQWILIRGWDQSNPSVIHHTILRKLLASENGLQNMTNYL